MAKLSYKERARLRREEEILRTAARMIRDHGYNNLNMDDLAEEVGISKPTLYQHFDGKDDMVAKTMLQTMREMEEHMRNIEGDSAYQKLENIMRYMLDAHTNPDGFSIAIVQDTATTLQHLMSTETEMFEIRMRVTEQLYSLIEQAKAEGDIRQDIPNLIVTSAMFSSLSILKSPHILNDYANSIDHIIEHIIGMFRRGVRT